MINLLAATAALFVAAPTNMTFKPHLESVSIFRDGYGYFVKKGSVKLEDGWATANFLPDAIDGTVWVYSTNPAANVDEVIATKSNDISFKDAAGLKAALGDKVGLNFTITLKNGQSFTGALNRLLDDMLLLDNGSGYSGIPYGNIQKVKLDGFPLKVHVSGVNKDAVIGLRVAYLEEGVRWQPSYVMDVRNGIGKLDLRASLANSVQDFNGTKLNFVVGSPFVTQRGINDLLGSVSLDDAAHASSITISKKDGRKAATEPDEMASSAPSMGASTTVDRAGELYYYVKPHVHLAKGDVAMMTLAQSTGPAHPEYMWNADGDSVKYLLQFKNTLDEPLTTGSVLVIDNGKAVGQDTLTYVPSGGMAKISLAEGIGVHVRRHEIELKRGGTVRIGKDDYIPVTMEGTLTIDAHRSHPVEMTITKTIRGKVMSLSHSGVIGNTQVLSGEANTVNDVKWKVSVASGKPTIIHYTYQTYISANAAGSPPVPIYPNDQP